MGEAAISYKLEDFNILNEDYIEITVGKEMVKIEELSIAGFYRYVPLWQELMVRFARLIVTCEVDLGELDKIKDGKGDQLLVRLQNLFSYADFRKAYVKLLKKIKIFKMSRRKFEEQVKISQLPLIFVTLYYFNTDGLKKKFLSLVDKISFLKTLISGIFIMNSPGEDGLTLGEGKLEVRYRRLTPLNN